MRTVENGQFGEAASGLVYLVRNWRTGKKKFKADMSEYLVPPLNLLD